MTCKSQRYLRQSHSLVWFKHTRKMYDTSPSSLINSHQLDAQALTYIDSGTTEIGGLLRDTSGATPGSFLHKFSHAMDDMPAWEVRGKSYGFSSIGIPITHPGLDSFNKAISAWVDEKIQSKSNMAALAGYGVDMDHPCVRVYTKEGVDANRTFLVASAESFTMHEFFNVWFPPVSTILHLTFFCRGCQRRKYRVVR